MVFSSEEDDHLAVVMMMVVIVVPPPPGLAVMIVVVVLMVVMMIAMGRGRLDRGGQRAGGDEDGDEAGRKGTLQHDDLLDP